jgi:paraquat-inducible protein A
MQHPKLMACHECDFLHRIEPLDEGQTALCRRCGSVLLSHKRKSFENSLSLAIAALILYIMANAYPLLEIKSGSLYQAVTLIGSVDALFAGGMWHIGLVVFLTAVLFPLLELISMLAVLIPLQLGKTPWWLASVLRFIQSIRPWGMMEVFMLGVLVSIVKLVKMVKVIPGISLWAFAVLIFVFAATTTSFDFHRAWETLEEKKK